MSCTPAKVSSALHMSRKNQNPDPDLQDSPSTYIGIKLIVLSRQHHLPEVLTDARHTREINAVVVNPQELMNHGLICPLPREEHSSVVATCL